MVNRELPIESQRDRLAPERFRDAARRISHERLTSPDEEAAAFSLDDLRLVLGAIRLAMKVEIERLPDEAFDDQPVDSAGGEIWTAGQVVNHIGHVQIGFADWLHRALGCDAPGEEHPLLNLTDADMPGMLTREQALHVLDAGEADLEALFVLIPNSVAQEMPTTHPCFGSVGIKGGILATILHENEHLEQLAGLRRAPAHGVVSHQPVPLTPYQETFVQYVAVADLSSALS